jgi:hypothetical protein
MHLVGTYFLTQCGLHGLVALDQAFAFERGRDDDGAPVTAIAIYFEKLALQASGDEVVELFRGHIKN